ncbi:sodium:solute symporter [Prevotella lacticifex]|jgi:SSS family solute:Na+ symporter|uniref:Solute:sodium symporter family transporter n=1 Tax=Prevotella lacticifex TaxID=2854755 RepID=A0A9R1C992_9BACT|nr:sodium:solute symporter [Prevotella lacticifex]GJG35124.1 solute:sodium symporter family transporter [Prevotella lacticifex]GJG39825.1 solute:sodium symporter family transporter [Prevotella lacticifex]GJG41493.1 solute:sodium symporter family transporter [Prevotella lacticifex]GJG46179.1 solute:sodium symporter family transporter [Prevotella lacticifex]GJG47845.1 solute:sodium symporter family transporter [Prevotella lacticifex]
MNWSSHEFIWLDWAVLTLGIIAVICAVYISIVRDKRKMKGADSQDYLFGKGEPWWVIGAAIFAANIGSEHLVGLAGTGAKDGVGMAHWEMQGWMILILGWLFVPFYQLLNNKLGRIITMPEFLKFRYTKRTGTWLSVITLIAYILTKVSVTAFTGGIFFEFLLGIPFWYGALGLILITAVFTIFGGMKGVMTMSAIQTPILIIGSFLVLFLGLATLGDGSITQGWSSMMEFCGKLHNGYGTTHMFHWEEGDPMYHDYPGFVVFLGASIIGFWYWCTDQHIVQRVLGQRKGEDNREVMKRARRGTICAGYFKLLPVFMFLIPGMIAAALAADPAKYGFHMGADQTDAAFALMVKDVLPAGVKGLVTVGFVCALVTSLAAFFNSCATLFTEDFYKPLRPGKSEKHYVFAGRMATVAVVILGLLWMPVMMSMDTLYSYLQNIQSLLAPAMVAVFALGIFSKRITPKAGEWGLIGGFVIGMLRLLTNIITKNGNDPMSGAFWDCTSWFWQTNWLVFECWLLVFIIVMMFVISAFTKKASADQIAAITFTSDYRSQIRESWDWRDVAGSLGVIALCGAFYWYFF